MNTRFELLLKAVDTSTPGYFKFRASRPTVDRDGEVVDVSTFTLRKRTPIYIDHDHRTSKDALVATASLSMDGDDLIVEGKFLDTDQAQFIRAMLDDEEHRDAIGMSIGALGVKRAVKDGRPLLTGGEVMETSFTGIPSNRDTQLLGLKSATVDDDKAVKGSAEEKRDLVMAEIGKVEDYAYPIALLDDAIVYEAYADGAWKIFRRSFEFVNGAVKSIGDAVEGQIVTEFRAFDQVDASKNSAVAADDDAVVKTPVSLTVTPDAACAVHVDNVTLARAALALS